MSIRKMYKKKAVDEFNRLMSLSYEKIKAINYPAVMIDVADQRYHKIRLEKKIDANAAIKVSLVYEDFESVILPPELIRPGVTFVGPSVLTYSFLIYPDNKVISLVDEDYDD